MTRPVARIFALTGVFVAIAMLIIWQSGLPDGVTIWAQQQQQQTQALMAGALRRLQAGDPGATLALLGISFAYGVLHAAGPGHGKVLIGSYGFATDVPFARLAGLSLAASLAQALTAVLLVWGGVSLLDLSRAALTDLSDNVMADIGNALIAAVGVWLAWRGLRLLYRQARAAGPHRAQHVGHHHDHVHSESCGCGHAHGPSADDIRNTRSLRDAVVLIAGIAVRPCTGAVFLLLLTWRMQVFPVGVAAAFAMGLGTGLVTVLVAGMSIWARHSSLTLIPETGIWGTVARWLPGVLQLVAGLLVAVIAVGLLR